MMLTAAFCLAILVQQPNVVTQGGPPPEPVPTTAPATLPDTPQGKIVKAYIDAFNSGDEQKYLKAQETLMSPDVLAKRPVAERSKMFSRLRGDFGTLKVQRAVGTAGQIRVVVPDKEGNEAIFSFDFDTAVPYKIKGIRVDIGNAER